jgi:Xaa-Pro aminopeptidase
MNGKNGNAPATLLENRLSRLRQSMACVGAEACLVVCLEGRNWENVFFLSGFRGSHSALLVSQEKALLVTDGRYLRQAESQASMEVVDQGSEGVVKTVKRFLGSWGIKKAALEQKRVPHFFALSLGEQEPIEWIDGSSLVEELRREKSEAEAGLIGKAAKICSVALAEVLHAIRPGITEREIAARLECSIRLNGAEGTWGEHEFIVASGLRSAMPHGTPTEKTVENGEWVTLDFGARVEGYLCDITRNIAVGTVPERACFLHGLLNEAQEEAFRAVRPGVKACEVDAVARRIIEKAGYGEAFSHGLGHGLGLELHEMPRVSLNSGDVLKKGDVITIEPGIYLPDFGGLRVEDDCLVTGEGAVWLTRSVPSGFMQAR